MPVRRAVPSGPRFVWMCSVCRTPIQDGKGYLWANYAEIGAREKRERDRILAAPQPLKLVPLSVPDPLEGYGRFRTHHRSCDPDIDASAYTIEVERIRTPKQLLDWCAQLSGKRWLRHTNWSSIVREAWRQMP